MPPVETRSPTARAAATVSRGCQNMSITVVTPPSSELGEAERRPEPHRLADQDRAFRLPDGLQPRLQRQILDQPAEQAVPGMAMHVDQPRHQQHAARIDDLRRRRADRRRRPDPGDPPAAHRDRTVAEHRAGGIGGDDQRMGDDKIGPHGGSGVHARPPPVNAERRPLPAAISRPRRCDSPSASSDDSRAPTACCTAPA